MIKRTVHPFLALLALSLLFAGCSATKENLAISKEEKALFRSDSEEPVEITDAETEYEIIIIEPGFHAWLNSMARPEGYYSQSFFESRNAIMVSNWNQRVLQPSLYDPGLYEMQIDYDPGIDYGYEVNYKLYNYFIYFQRKYNQRLGPFIPRI